MISVFKPTGSRKWVISYKDETGRLRKKTGFTDKAATQRLANDLERKIGLRRDGVLTARDDGYAEAERKPLMDHVADWHGFILGKNRTAKHADLSRNRLTKVLETGKAQRLTDLTLTRIQGALKALNDAGLSLRSIAHHVRALKSFSRWLQRDARTRDDLLIALTPPNFDCDRRHQRRELTTAELERLIRAAEQGDAFRGLIGADRAMLYRVAVGTGLRCSEILSLTPESFIDLDGDQPVVRVKAVSSKRRREENQPMPRPLADALADWLVGKPTGQPLFKFKVTDAARIIRRDLAAAGIEYESASGVADFHALRVSYITMLGRSNLSLKTLQTLARHSDPRLTLNTYSRVSLQDQSAALESLPSLAGTEVNPMVLALTGTDSFPGATACATGDDSGMHKPINTNRLRKTQNGFLIRRSVVRIHSGVLPLKTEWVRLKTPNPVKTGLCSPLRSGERLGTQNARMRIQTYPNEPRVLPKILPPLTRI